MSPKTRSPALARFLSDFTLGFSDGLTVPFALTAGLSSLGRADTVICAGIAELCAGSISMGIGGYLAALDELPASASAAGISDTAGLAGEDEELRGMLQDESENSFDEKSKEDEETVIRRHLEPLALSNSTLSDIMATIIQSPDGLARAALRLQSHNDTLCELSSADSSGRLPVWPVYSGLFICLGYVVGGIIPLIPYFFASTVGSALEWSIGLCLAALFIFGAGKSYALHGAETSFRRCLWEGSQMLVLGGVAAAAAVVCVKLLDPNGGSVEGS